MSILKNKKASLRQSAELAWLVKIPDNPKTLTPLAYCYKYTKIIFFV